MKIIVVSPEVPSNIKELINIEEYKVYACDSAVSDLYQQNINIDLAIGDFDSLEDLSLLDNIKTISLSKEKDYSDTSYAINHAYNHSKEVILVGGIKGSRSDHFIANVLLLEQFKGLVIMDDTNRLFIVEKGIHIINKNQYDYLTVLPLTDCTITLKGTKYPLDNKFLNKNDQLGLSNEIILSSATIEVEFGKVLIIQSK